MRAPASRLAALCAASFIVVAPAVSLAQTVTASQDLSCAGFRHGSELGCTAGEFTVGATFTAAPGSPAFCTAGEIFIFDAALSLSGSNADRYDMGFFVGQQNNSPTAATAGNICSVAVFPDSPLPFMDVDGDACGDYDAAGVSQPIVQGLKVVCSAASGSDLTIPYVLTYLQNTGGVCSVGNVGPSSPSKCNAGSATLEISAVPVQVGGYVDITKQTSPDSEGQAFSYTATSPAGSTVGVEKDGVFTANNTNSITFSLTDGETARVYMSVIPSTTRVLTITEEPSGQPTHWESQANISCAATLGSPALSTNNATRTIQASLNTIHKGAACAITNTRRARVSLVEQVNGRLYGADQFQLSVSGAGASSLTSEAGASIAASAVTVTTTGSATGGFTNATHPQFRATPGQALTLTTAMAAGSTSTLASYGTTLTCTNAFTGPGATTVLPTNQVASSYSLTPKPGDDITCTYTHTPRAVLTLSKVVINDDGLTSPASAWTLKAVGPVTISGATGSAAVTNAPVPVGTYTLSETGPVSYAMTSLSCTGTADGNPSDGLALVSGELASCTFTNNDQLVGQTLVKSSASLFEDPDGSGTVTEGDTLYYTVTLTNTGVNTLTNVQVDDAQLTPASISCASVVAGATCTLSGTHLVTAAELAAGEVVNTATVTSTEIPGPTSSNTVTTPVLARPAPTLEVVKSHAGNFSAGSPGTYTLLVSNVGYGEITGTTTVTDTLDPGLAYVSGTGTGWTCGAATGPPEVVTCTSTASVASFDDMAPITLTVMVAGNAGSSVDNTASVANTTINGGTPAVGNTDTATIIHPDLSTSTKAIVNLGGGATPDVDTGDVLQYTINVTETAGATASGVHVTDVIQSGLTGLTVTQVPAGATNSSTGSVVDISGITVPANGTVQVKFRVTVGAGFALGATIDNTATIDNPGGPDAAPEARTLVYSQSQVVSTEDKVLYVQNGNVLNREPHGGIDTTGTPLPATAAGVNWTTDALAKDLVLNAGTIDIDLSLTTDRQTPIHVELWDGATQIGASSVQNLDFETPQVSLFQVVIGADYTLLAGDALTLRVINSGNKTATVYAFNVGPSKISFGTSTVVHVDSVVAYAEPYATGNTVPAYFVLGETAYVRVVASDPFGGTDVSASDSTITVTDANGATFAGTPAPMTVVDTTGATRTFEYEVPVPTQAPLGVWAATATAYEGTEGTVNHTSSGTFEVRGRVTLDQAWGTGATTGDAVQLQVTGGLDAVDGSSTAPGPATAATATAGGGDPITLLQAFTSGSAGNYSVTLACTRDADGAALAVTGSGLSRAIDMPLDSSVTCTWVDTPSIPLTIVKLAMVRSDPVNGTINPKAIPGATVEYQLILSNPAPTAIDSGTLVVTDPIPANVDLRVANIGGPSSGPVLFTNGSPSSGLTYTFSGLASTTDDVDFSNDNGASWTYVPTPDAAGLDAAVTDIRINPKGAFAPDGAQFTLRFRVVIQ